MLWVSLHNALEGGKSSLGDGLVFCPAQFLESLVAGSGGCFCPASVVLLDCLFVEEHVVLEDGVVHPCLCGLKMFGRPAIRRLARRGGVKRISGPIYDETCHKNTKGASFLWDYAVPYWRWL